MNASGSREPLSAREAAKKVLENCALRYVDPTGFAATPQQVINRSIDRATAIIAQVYEECARIADAEKARATDNAKKAKTGTIRRLFKAIAAGCDNAADAIRKAGEKDVAT